MYIPNVNTQNHFCTVDYNKWLDSLETELNKPTNQSPKFSSERIRKQYYKTLGTSVINSLLSLLSLVYYTNSVKELHTHKQSNVSQTCLKFKK